MAPGAEALSAAELLALSALLEEDDHERLLLEVKKTDKAHKLITGSRVSSASGQHLTLPG